VLRLRANDSLLNTADDITVTVNPAPPVNQRPVVNAGPDQTITLPSNASLTGTAGDDGLPNPPGALTLKWSKVSGPGTATFANANAASTTASFSQAGTYVLRLSANDSLVSRTDDITVAVNQPPVVNAGPDQTITLPSSASLAGSATDDGLPNPPGKLTFQWSKVSGPGTATFADASATNTTVSFSQGGIYVLRLYSSDGLVLRFDDITVTVNPASPVNQPPVVDAGPDQTILITSAALLPGQVTAPLGGAIIHWRKSAGPVFQPESSKSGSVHLSSCFSAV
jgi:hypothetical protein